MTMHRFEGSDLWVPMPYLALDPVQATMGNITLDADEEEVQFIGHIILDGGQEAGSKTFGTSSKIHWRTSTPITFASGATLRLGVKQASSISTSVGPPPRATIGAAAFDVYQDLVGGTDTISAITDHSTAMDTGSLSVAHGDLIAICFHLDVSSGTPSVLIRCALPGFSTWHFPATTLITSGPTYTAQQRTPAFILEFDDGSYGWLPLTFCQASMTSQAVGSAEKHGVLWNRPFPSKIDALRAYVQCAGGTSDFKLAIWSDPFGTPVEEASVSIDGNWVVASNRLVSAALPESVYLKPNTDYVLGVERTGAGGVNLFYEYQDIAQMWAARFGRATMTYQSASTGAFSEVGSYRRPVVNGRVCAFDDAAPWPQGFVGIGMGG